MTNHSENSINCGTAYFTHYRKLFIDLVVNIKPKSKKKCNRGTKREVTLPNSCKFDKVLARSILISDEQKNEVSDERLI